jgi:hypothetical protein
MMDFVMAGHSRSKNGVASLAYVPAIHVLFRVDADKTWMPATSAGMTERAALLDRNILERRRLNAP